MIKNNKEILPTINKLQTVRRAQFEANVELNPTLFYFYAL